MKQSKNQHLQLRLNSAQKAAIRAAATATGMDMSEWVLLKVLPPVNQRLQQLIDRLQQQPQPEAIAELSDALNALTAAELELGIESLDVSKLSLYWQNYVAAMLEEATTRHNIKPPSWLAQVAPLAEPHFSGGLESLKTYLLLNAPIPYRRRNIFVDSGIAARV